MFRCNRFQTEDNLGQDFALIIQLALNIEWNLRRSKLWLIRKTQDPRLRILGDKAIGSDYAEILSDFFSRYVILEMQVTWHHKNSSVCEVIHEISLNWPLYIALDIIMYMVFCQICALKPPHKLHWRF